MDAVWAVGDHAECLALIRTAMANTTDPLDKSDIYNVQIKCFVSQGRLKEAIDHGLVSLHNLGVDIAQGDAMAPRIPQLLARLDLDPAQIAGLLALPELSSVAVIKAFRHIRTLMGAIYISRGDLLAIVVLTWADLAVTHGRSGDSAYAFCLFGLLLCAGAFGAVLTSALTLTWVAGPKQEIGYLWGQRAVAMIDSYRTHTAQCEVHKVRRLSSLKK